jgi:hypothetical protein
VRSTYRYYRCLGNKNVDRRLGQPCPSKAVRADVLEGIVWQDLCEFVRNPGALLGEVEARLSQEPAAREERARELENLARSLARCGEERARLINIYRKGRKFSTSTSQTAASFRTMVAPSAHAMSTVTDRDRPEPWCKKDGPAPT